MKMPDISDLIGVRFLDHGRDKRGFDCYGLAIEVSRRWGHELKDLWYERADSDTFADNAEDMIKAMSDKVEGTDEQAPGNLVIFLEFGRMVHIGVIIEEDMFIHCDRYGVRIIRLSDYYRKVWKVYRWKSV